MVTWNKGISERKKPHRLRQGTSYTLLLGAGKHHYMTTDYSSMLVLSPKRASVDGAGESRRIFPYYAGYSFAFAKAALSSLHLGPQTIVLDPWNGAGTTTTAAAGLGLRSIGTDLNPVMVLVAKASLLSREEIPSLLPLAKTIIKLASEIAVDHADDPLAQWLIPSSAQNIRVIDVALRHALLPANIDLVSHVDEVSPLAAFFYVCLFRTTKSLLRCFVPSNPTWVRSPKSQRSRLRPARSTIYREFLQSIDHMSQALSLQYTRTNEESTERSILLADATALPLEKSSVDLVLTSPPYCTRIDYAVATSIELAVLGFNRESLTLLRRSLMGTSMVSKAPAERARAWGEAANIFLDKLSNHPSKASKTYYLKNHLDYFNSLFKATSELDRVMKPDGGCIIVAQDSYYKDIHNDVPRIICEMMAANGFYLARCDDFSATRSMVTINTKARKYRTSRDNRESVLCFSRA